MEAAGNNVIYTYRGNNKDSNGAIFNYRAKLRGIEAFVDIVYVVNNDGSLTTNLHYQAQSNELPEMMRFGMLMVLPEQYDYVNWYGRGPRENYIDRNGDTFLWVYGMGLSLIRLIITTGHKKQVIELMLDGLL